MHAVVETASGFNSAAESGVATIHNMKNHFDLFHLPQQFSLDMAALDFAYRQVQAQVHPDRFVNASNAEQRAATQWAIRANEAYQALKNPLKRAVYLCELRGVSWEDENRLPMPPDFLMQQMEWRELLQEAREAKDVAALELLDAAVRKEKKGQMKQLAQSFDEANGLADAALIVRKSQFLEKLGAELVSAFDELE